MAQTWLIKTYVDNASRECSITPGDFISPSTVNELSIVRALNRTVDDLLDRHDWSRLTDITTVTGTGDTTYSLPAAFTRLCRQDNAVYELSPNRRPVMSMSTRSDWTEREAWNPNGPYRVYRLGNNIGDPGSTGEYLIEFLPALPVNGEIDVHSLNNQWVLQADGNRATSYTNTDDLSVLPGMLLELGTIWRFKMSKGLPYADYKADYESNLARKMAEDSPARKIDFTAERNPDAHPMRVPIPDFIPSS